jgi:hypothetical protein
MDPRLRKDDNPIPDQVGDDMVEDDNSMNRLMLHAGLKSEFPYIWVIV